MKLGHIGGTLSWEEKRLMVAGFPLDNPEGSQGPYSCPRMNPPHLQLDRVLSCTEIVRRSYPSLVLSCPIYTHFNRLPHEPLFSLIPSCSVLIRN